jgi:thermitase
MRRTGFYLLISAVVCLSFLAGAAETNSLTWQTASDQVSADLHGEHLFPLLESIARQTGWHIFVEPEADRSVSVKFNEVASGEALHKLLGDLNFALVPKTDGPWHLYVFTTRMENATRRVGLEDKVVAAKQKHVPNQLLVKLKPGANIDAVAKSVGAKVVGRNDQLGLYLLEFPDAAATDAALAQLQGNSDVQSVDYNYIYDPAPTPQPYSGSAPRPAALTLDPPTQGDPCSPIIGMIDTMPQASGTSLDQFVLPPISVAGADTSTPAGITHATAMYQTILNAVGQASGGHTSARIQPVNVFGPGDTANTWSVALGVQAAVNSGATVLNMSLGGTADSPILENVVNQALAQGVVIFAAAGNQPVNTPTFPAAISGVYAVTALSAPGQLASYANYGSFVSLALPGASVVSLGGQSYVVQGTSPATAYATGVAVGTKGVNCASWSQIEGAMQQKFPMPQGQQ